MDESINFSYYFLIFRELKSLIILFLIFTLNLLKVLQGLSMYFLAPFLLIDGNVTIVLSLIREALKEKDNRISLLDEEYLMTASNKNY